MIFGTVDIRNSEGCYLAHSLRTHAGRISKGTLITSELAAQLADSGFEQIVAARLETGDVHEDEASFAIARELCGSGVALSSARTGRVNLLADIEGLCRFDAQVIMAANAVDEGITVATLGENQWVAQGRMLATVKIIPYAVRRDNLQQVLALLADQSLLVSAAVPHTAELIQTRLGSVKEIVLDKTRRITENRLTSRSVRITIESRCEHTHSALLEELIQASQRCPDWILIVGASAISDRADVIPQAIVDAGGKIDRYGIPVDPGNLLLLGQIGVTKVIGLPGCARSSRYNGLDMILDRMACDIPVNNQWLSGLSVGGLLAEIVDRPEPRISLEPHKAVGALILAAGFSRRAGQTNKLLARYGNSTMVSHVAQTVTDTQADRVVVVTGFEQEAVEQALAATSVEICHNKSHPSGMASSVVVGLSCMMDKDAVVICLGDMPHVSIATIDSLIDAFRAEPEKSIFIPVVDKRRGNPVLFSKVFFDNLLSLEGDTGARLLVQQYPDEVCEVTVDDEGVLLDYDTEEDLSRLSP